MASVCSFRQPNVNVIGGGTGRGVEGTSYRILESLNKHGQFSCEICSHSRLFSEDRLRKKLKKTVYCSKGEFNNGWLGYRSPVKTLGSGLRYCFQISRRVAQSRRCQVNDSVAYVDGNGWAGSTGSSDLESTMASDGDLDGNNAVQEEEKSEVPSLEDLRQVLQKACKELEIARVNSTMFEEKAHRISEAAIALKDEAENAWNDVNSKLRAFKEIEVEESNAKDTAHEATVALSLADARLQFASDLLEVTKQRTSLEIDTNSLREKEDAILDALNDIKACEATLLYCEAELKQVQIQKDKLQMELDRLKEVAEKAERDALKAEEDVANIMLLAEQAVAFEVEATQRVNDAEIALQKAEKNSPSLLLLDYSGSVPQNRSLSQEHDLTEGVITEEKANLDHLVDNIVVRSTDLKCETSSLNSDALSDSQFDILRERLEDSNDLGNGQLSAKTLLDEIELEAEKSKNSVQTTKTEMHKDLTKDNSSLNAPKALPNKSSRFFSASFFSFDVDETEFAPFSLFHGLTESGKKQLPKLVLGLLLAGAGIAFYGNRSERAHVLFQQPDTISTTIDELMLNEKPVVRQISKVSKRIQNLLEKLPRQEINEEEASLFDMLWLLLASVIFVPLFQKIPGGSPVLGYLTAGILIGPYGLSIIHHVHATKAIAEFGVVFLLFNIGLELSVERLSSMKKYVFGLGSAQVLATAMVVGLVAHFVFGLACPAAIVIGNGLALSSTAVVLQVLQERGESTSRHGRATFSVLLFQDLAVVVLLILIPLISPNSSKGGIGFQAIAEALGLAGLKAIVAISAIIAGGRLLLRPIYRQIAEIQNAEIFSANTLLVILGTSLLTARSGLSMALGAFLAGLLLAETEFSLQVESDIAPYRGLLLGLFFMTVGMSIDPKLLLSNFPVIMGTLGLLIGGKTILVVLIGRMFGVSTISAIRVGLLLAPGGEFAFVAFGEAVNQGIMSSQLSSLLFLVVGISMALTPWLAAGGQLIASRFEQQDVRSLLPVESETDDLQDHIIICGFGRVGQIIAQLLSERLIPFVALDVRSDRVAIGRALDLPVFFGDAGSREILHKVGAERACAAAITLDTPGANYRTVWALNKYFPNVKTFVRAHDVDHGLKLEKAGATAVVPETLEPSLQLAAAVLAQVKLPMSEIAATINEFRSRHLSELTELSETSGSSLGYGYSQMSTKAKSQPSTDPLEDNQVSKGTLAL
ncbi:K(+) efflux antiporter 2, chloroplastic-like [Heracleum sosnowskyi]|uniref:K(+) efflux antiporter 2, chloroplastic-like n=1 Tax=Heracleum sosnowskyi TaxID=360622 RepID=A0AAD8M8B1_9APIA|nr:K(+) efflux antiporter 2, chloroplastic-like [Heracleum sosnowskyi]